MGRAEGKRPAPQPGRRSWPAALLAASVFGSCFLLTQAQDGGPQTISVIQTPPVPIEGRSVSLTPGGSLKNAVSCSWFRGRVTDLTKRILQYHLPPSKRGQVNGPAFTGRETGGPDCSLHIRNLTLTDSGNYTVATEGHVTAIGYVTMTVSDRFTNENEVFYPCQAKYPPNTKPGAGSGPLPETRRSGLWISLGSLAAILALAGTLLYFLLRARCRRNRIPNQSALAFYSNLSTSEEDKPRIARAVSNVYQNLEPGNQAVH